MFAVILLPNFRLQSVLRFREELDGRAVAIVDEHAPKAGVLEMSEAAAEAGVLPGQTSPQAQARCGGLLLVARSAVQEQNVQAALLEIASTLSPEVEATADGFCTVNLQTSRSHDWSALGRYVVESLAALRLRAQVGVGLNPDLAFLAARHARPVLVVQSPGAFLSELALHELDPEPELLAVLRDWGIHNLARLTSLPRGDLMDRLGPEASRLWERAAGQAQRPLRVMRSAEEFVEAFDFEHEIDTAEPLLFLLRRFLDQLALRLGNAYRVAGRMTLVLPLANDAVYERSFTVPSPTADVEVLFRILHTHIEGLKLDHCATGVRLRIEPTRAERQQFQLFETPLRDPNRFGETLGRLAALVGTENVGVVEVLDTHKPDSFRLRTPRFHELRAAGAVEEDFAVGLPLRRFRPPIPVSVRVVRQHLVFIESARVRGAVRETLGPYRASGGWWESDAWATEEWDVEMENGGLYRLARVRNEWRIEGSYDEAPPENQRGHGAVVPMWPRED
jgi:protein ImuB